MTFFFRTATLISETLFSYLPRDKERIKKLARESIFEIFLTRAVSLLATTDPTVTGDNRGADLSSAIWDLAPLDVTHSREQPHAIRMHYATQVLSIKGGSGSFGGEAAGSA